MEQDSMQIQQDCKINIVYGQGNITSFARTHGFQLCGQKNLLP